jgi:hypothetical protein
VEVKQCARFGFHLALAVLWALALPGGASANPLPEAAVFVHVQPPAPGSPPLGGCDQIVQHTSATGELEFDLYLKCFVCEPGMPLSAASVEFDWDPDWTWLGYELPEGATGSVSVNGAQASAELSWPDCPPLEAEVTLLLRCFLAVTGTGDFGMAGAPTVVEVGCPPPGTQISGWVLPARAGVVCAYCWTDCAFGDVCCPSTPTTLLTLAVPQGEPIVETLDYHVWGGMWPCPLEASGSEAWMGVSAESTGEGSYQVTLSVDTGSLAPGHYAGWVRGESDGVACTRVELEVLLPTGVPAGPLDPSWGAVKAYY